MGQGSENADAYPRRPRRDFPQSRFLVRQIPACVIACENVETAVVDLGAFFHFLYPGSINNSPTYSDRSLQGACRGPEGDLVLTDGGNWRSDGDWGIIVNAKRYRVSHRLED